MVRLISFLKLANTLISNTVPSASYFSLRAQRKVTKRKCTLLLVFAPQKFPPSGAILAVVEKGHPWPSAPQLGIPPNCPPKSHLRSAKRREFVAPPQHFNLPDETNLVLSGDLLIRVKR
jgi:hypothetical protein